MKHFHILRKFQMLLCLWPVETAAWKTAQIQRAENATDCGPEVNATGCWTQTRDRPETAEYCELSVALVAPSAGFKTDRGN